jgi:hypothetical protein
MKALTDASLAAKLGNRRVAIRTDGAIMLHPCPEGPIARFGFFLPTNAACAVARRICFTTFWASAFIVTGFFLISTSM